MQRRTSPLWVRRWRLRLAPVLSSRRWAAVR
jgi:hypothetical protein